MWTQPEYVQKLAIAGFVDISVEPTRIYNVEDAREFLTAEGIDVEKPFVAVSPVALWETKLWQDEKFARLCDRIAGELNIPVVITGSAHEKPYAELIIKEVKTAKVVNLAGQTTLKDLACLYRQAAEVFRSGKALSPQCRPLCQPGHTRHRCGE